ncbi:phosphomevalonate kinase [Mycobacterium sp. M1]|uniref:phosphomevalonate kinase n=1 Tax=Mycolicibacter acidiphilus TaxID=2835306 RepID=A0ABS5RKZ8_9MYCO|nr:phosphomevalonate kinase [Mycolicibacter acidiphilus]MBS9534988.1 phosphomevalonate kinase [Mycolicibacter acidiphilus]
MTLPTTRRAPGKLFITGEYAVMEPGSPALLVAVDRMVSVTATSIEAGIELTTDLHPEPVRLHWQGLQLAGNSPDDDAARGRLSHAVAALEVLGELLTGRGLPAPALHLTIVSDLHEAGTKFGLGSSGAVTVATIDTVSAHCGLPLSADERYRLALIASARLDPQASGADLAAAVLRGWIVYRAPDRTAVLDLVRRDGLESALRASWPGLGIRRLNPPAGLQLAVGWTGSPAVTAELLGGSRWHGTAAHRQFVAAMAASAQATVDALERGDTAAALAQLAIARQLLAELDNSADVGIFTDKLIALCDAADAAGWVAKPSGAGGGDCGIALSDGADAADVERLRGQWETVGVRLLPLEVIGDGTDGHDC